MRLLFLSMILLAFPVLELVLLIELAQRHGWWLAPYLLVSAILGLLLIQDERIGVFGRMVQTQQEGRHPLLAILASASKMIAGLLLIIPVSAPHKRMPRDEDSVIEGEWRWED